MSKTAITGRSDFRQRASPKEAISAERKYLLDELARRLMSARVKKGWSQSELARRASVYMPDKKQFGRDSVSKYERGSKARGGEGILPTPVSLNALAKALGMEPQDLLPTATSRALSEPISEFEMRAVGDGTMWLRINQAVPTKDAWKIYEIIEKAKG